MENENAFKNIINEKVVKKIAKAIKKYHAKFSVKRFEELIPSLYSLELKNRVLLITEHIANQMSDDYIKNIHVIKKVIQDDSLKGFELWPLSEFISQFGLDHFSESMEAMYELTQRFTSEYAIRPFLIKDHIKVLKYFKEIVKDENVHIRRWVSEGTRPLLPWGQKIKLLVDDPKLASDLLESLRYDEELYVRKSVANHLNDISKNHPLYVIELLSRWIKECPKEHEEKINWIKKHALRGLIKKGHPGALKLMGVKGEGKIKINCFNLNQKTYQLNDIIAFSFEIRSVSKQVQRLLIDYAIDFVKANGKTGRKVFKLRTLDLEAGSTVQIQKSHSLKPITTMKYYSGQHCLSLQINGVCIHKEKFLLKISSN